MPAVNTTEQLKNRIRTRSITKQLRESHMKRQMEQLVKPRVKKDAFIEHANSVKEHIAELESKICTRSLEKRIQQYKEDYRKTKKTIIIKYTNIIRNSVDHYSRIAVSTNLLCFIRENCQDFLENDRFKRVFINKVRDFNLEIFYITRLPVPHEHVKAVNAFNLELLKCNQLCANLYM